MAKVRLIDADALREKAEVIIDENYDDHVVVYAEDIDNAPTIDAVPVVRCKDCEYYDGDECQCPYIFMSDGAHMYPDPDDFCSYGERREENG